MLAIGITLSPYAPDDIGFPNTETSRDGWVGFYGWPSERSMCAHFTVVTGQSRAGRRDGMVGFGIRWEIVPTSLQDFLASVMTAFDHCF